MPVSYVPVIFPALLIGVPLISLVAGRKTFLRTTAASASILLILLLRIYLPGWILMCRTARNDPAAVYELARWTECHDIQLGRYILWPVTPKTLAGYDLLERSAAMDYPPAVYALGVRLKYGMFVPEPPNWTGPGGNVFEQPERGQPLIDRAIRLGYKPMIDEERFYPDEYVY